MFKSTIHGHFNATNTRANGRHRPLDSKHLNMALWPNHAKNTLCASSSVTTSHVPPIAPTSGARLPALGLWTVGNGSAARRRLRLLQRPPQASTRHSDVLSEVAGGRDEHVDARMPRYTQRENGDADACGRASGRW